MSQRLFVGKTDAPWYDAVVTDAGEEGLVDRLAKEWLSLEEGNPFFLGPWRVFISDFPLFSKISPKLDELFSRVGKEYPDCVWDFMDVSREETYSEIIHPTKEQLAKWVDGKGVQPEPPQ